MTISQTRRGAGFLETTCSSGNRRAGPALTADENIRPKKRPAAIKRL